MPHNSRVQSKDRPKLGEALGEGSVIALLSAGSCKYRRVTDRKVGGARGDGEETEVAGPHRYDGTTANPWNRDPKRRRLQSSSARTDLRLCAACSCYVGYV